MALAALGLMIWRPADLFSAGFQLSFGVVAGLLAFTGPIIERWAPATKWDDPPLPARLRRLAVEAMAVSTVAWLVAMPLVAFHFQALSLAALPVGLVMVPLGSALLWAGYAKILVGVVWPWAGAMLGPVVWMLASMTAGLVRLGAAMPWASIDLPAPSAAWATATLALIVLLLSRWPQRRMRWLSLAGLVICAAWLMEPVAAERWRLRDTPLCVNMFAVGDGSCYLLRSGGQAMMFDCGSNNYIDITTATIAPALRSLGVMRIPTLLVTHPDTDHFSGALELIDRFSVRRLLITEEFERNAGKKPAGAAAFLLASARQRGVEVRTIAAGWSTPLGDATIEAIWPPPQRQFERDNDSSIVLSIRAGSRRLLMTGDIQSEAMAAMLHDRIDLHSDIVELPHHGSHPKGAEAFIAAVNPQIVLQSTGVGRLRNDPWAAPLAGVQRHITARDGMVELMIDRQGRIAAGRFAQLRPGEAEETEEEPGVQ
jgi:competence protein ComEC